MKTCSKCKESKPLEMFSKNRSRKSGLQHECKACFTARMAAYRARPDVKVRGDAQKAEWYQQNREWCDWRSAQNYMLRGGR